MNYQDVIKKIASSTDISTAKVDRIYRYYWLFIKEKIESLDIKNLEELPSDFRTSFNIPSLGKLAIQKNIKEIKKYIKKHDKSKDD